MVRNEIQMEIFMKIKIIEILKRTKMKKRQKNNNKMKSVYININLIKLPDMNVKTECANILEKF